MRYILNIAVTNPSVSLQEIITVCSSVPGFIEGHALPVPGGALPGSPNTILILVEAETDATIAEMIDMDALNLAGSSSISFNCASNAPSNEEFDFVLADNKGISMTV